MLYTPLMKRKDVAIELRTLIDFGHELTGDLTEFMKMEDPVLYINSMCELLGYDFELDDIDTNDAVLMDMVLNHVYFDIVCRRISWCYRALKSGGGVDLNTPKSKGARLCNMVVGTIDDESSWHVLEELFDKTGADMDSMKNFDRYDKAFVQERGRIRVKIRKKDKDGNILPWAHRYVYRDPSTKYYGKKPKK